MNDIVWMSPNASDEEKNKVKRICEKAGRELVFEYNSIILSDPDAVMIISARKEGNNLQTLSLEDASNKPR